MRKTIFQLILVLVLGVIVMVVASTAFMMAINSNSFSVPLAVGITAALFMIFGLIAGIFWRRAGYLGGVLLIAPLFLMTSFSVLLSGLGPKFFSNDLPVLATALLTGIGGCYIGQHFASKAQNVV